MAIPLLALHPWHVVSDASSVEMLHVEPTSGADHQAGLNAALRCMKRYAAESAAFLADTLDEGAMLDSLRSQNVSFAEGSISMFGAPLLSLRSALVVRTEIFSSSNGDASSMPWSVVVVAPDMQPKQEGLALSSGLEVVVFVAEGSETSLRRLFDMFGSAGCIRSDLARSYKLSDKKLGDGGTASVVLAQARGRGGVCRVERRLVAAKVLSAPERQRDAMNEISHLVDVQGHPNVMRFFGLFCCEPPHVSGRKGGEGDVHDDDPAWRCPASPNWVIVMDAYPRGDLHHEVSTRGAYAEEDALELTRGVLHGLAHIHHRGVAHRDIKSENILISETGTPVITDFGIAARVSDAWEMRRCCGSPGYLAPEIALGKPYNEKVDIFAAGVVLYFAMSGALPFTGGDQAEALRCTAHVPVSFPENRFADVGVSTREFLEVVLRKRPVRRPTAAECLDILKAEPMPENAPADFMHSAAAMCASLAPSERARDIREAGQQPKRVLSATHARVFSRDISDGQVLTPEKPAPAIVDSGISNGRHFVARLRSVGARRISFCKYRTRSSRSVLPDVRRSHRQIALSGSSSVSERSSCSVFSCATTSAGGESIDDDELTCSSRSNSQRPFAIVAPSVPRQHSPFPHRYSNKKSGRHPAAPLQTATAPPRALAALL